MRIEPNRNLPACPACGSRHVPATLGSGARVWCDGSPAEPREHVELRAAQRAAQRAARERAEARIVANPIAQRFRAALRAEARARTGEPLDAIDAHEFRAALDALDDSE